MSFQPILPLGGYAGWQFLNRTMETQQQAFESSPTLERDLAYFHENIGKVTTAEGLVSDYRLLKVALGAFGLEEDIGNKFFVQKVLAEGTLDEEALSNKLADTRYRQFSAAFGFGDFSTPRTQLSTFADEISTAYKTRSFEVAVGEQDDSMRLALNLERELSGIAEKSSSDDAKWFSIMGSEPLREVFDTAFGLPEEFAALDLDRQLEVYRERAESLFGTTTVDQFQDSATREDLVRLFMLRSEIAAGNSGMSAAQTALTLLQSA